MYHFRTSSRAAVVLLAAAAGLMLGAAPAAAAQSGGMSSAPVSYTCDLSSYGQGLAPLTVNATVAASASATAGTPVTVTLVTSTTAIPSATSAMLPAINYMSVAGNASLSGSGSAAALAGKSQYLGSAAGQMDQIPSITATGAVTPQTAGMVSVGAPSSIRLVPTDTGGAMTPVLCTAASAVSVQVTVASTGTGTGTSGSTGSATASGTTQPYSCAVQVATATQPMLIPMRLSAAGPNEVAGTDQLSLTSVNPVAALAKYSPMSDSASLGLSGAASGQVPLNLGMPEGRLALTTAWQPERAGLFRLTAPHRFQFQVRQTTSTTVVVVCTATTATTASTTVRVATSAMSSTAAQGIAAAEGSSSVAPNTGAGGSLHSPVNVALLIAGAIAAAVGAVILVLAIRRRTGGTLIP